MNEKYLIMHEQKELISEEVKEIISYRPHWIVSRGNALFFIVVLFLLSLTWIVKYPDIVNASARLVAINPPKSMIAKAEGKLVKLFVANEQEVHKNQHLGYIESTSSYEQVMQLQDWISSTIQATQNNNYDGLVSSPLPDLTDLGELQANYQLFQNELAQTRHILQGGYYQKKKNALQKDVQYLAELKTISHEQKDLLTQDQQLQEKEYDAYEKLAKEKVIAPLELNQYKSKLISKDQSVKQINAQIINSDLSKQNKEKELFDLQKQVTDQEQQFHSSLLDLKSQVEKWLQKYVLMAPENGKVLFTSSLQENELITIGQQLFYIEPKETHTYAEVMASQQGLGKIKLGQQVLLKVESYPSREFGQLRGTVSYIANIPNRRDSFQIKVNLTDGLHTNYDKNIFFRNNLLARAEIITDDRKLIDRLLGQLRQVWDR